MNKGLVFTNGCFDGPYLTEGHLTCLREAAAQGDRLIVAVNTDASVKYLKGNDRPVMQLYGRMLRLWGLEDVGAVVSFNEREQLLRLIQTMRPEVLAKGGDYAGKEVVGADFVRSYGGRVHITSYVPGVSTTKILEGP